VRRLLPRSGSKFREAVPHTAQVLPGARAAHGMSRLHAQHWPVSRATRAQDLHPKVGLRGNQV
jgi:hypothetical protein